MMHSIYSELKESHFSIIIVLQHAHHCLTGLNHYFEYMEANFLVPTLCLFILARIGSISSDLSALDISLLPYLTDVPNRCRRWCSWTSTNIYLLSFSEADVQLSSLQSSLSLYQGISYVVFLYSSSLLSSKSQWDFQDRPPSWYAPEMPSAVIPSPSTSPSHFRLTPKCSHYSSVPSS